MVNITFMIGNGFDVGLGMKSRFKDFFPIYRAESLSKEKDIKMLSEEIENDYETWADFEIQMGMYTEKFTISDMQKYLLQYRDFQTEFMKYLEREQNKLSFNAAADISKMMISGLEDFYSCDNLQHGSNVAIVSILKQREGEERRYNFISFNYTSVLKKCLGTIPDGIVSSRTYKNIKIKDKIGKIVHVHGTKGHAPIMGVCESSQIANKEFAKNEKFLQRVIKRKINAAHRTNQDSEASTLISESTIICIYGMSLGATDKNWWNKILSWLNASKERHLVIFDYDKDFSMESQFDWIDKEDAIIDKLSGYNESRLIDLEKLRERIHIAVHKNIFEMDLAKEHNEIMDGAIDMLISGVNISA